MRFYSTRAKSMWIMLAVIFLPLYLGAPAYAGELVPIKGDFSGRIINEDIDSEFQGKTTLIGRTAGSFDSATGVGTWVTPDGDTITNVTTFFQFGSEISPGIFLFEQDIIFTGGTGKFSNAVGSATLTGTWNATTLEFEGFTNGAISRPNRRPNGRP